MKLQDVTLVSHGSVKKLAPLIDQVERWQGPVSFVIYLSSHTEIADFCLFLRDKATPLLFELTSIHVVVEKHGGRLPYPVNVARNLAQQSIESNFFLLMDVDFFAIKGGPPVVSGPAREDQESRPFLVSAPQQHAVCPAGL